MGSCLNGGYHQSLVSPSQKNSGPRQGRVRQLALRASLGSVSDSDHERVSWSLYKREVPPVCIPGATGDKGMKRISRHAHMLKSGAHEFEGLSSNAWHLYSMGLHRGPCHTNSNWFFAPITISTCKRCQALPAR